MPRCWRRRCSPVCFQRQTTKLVACLFRYAPRHQYEIVCQFSSEYGHYCRAWNVRPTSFQTWQSHTDKSSYFSRYALEEVFLKDERYAKFINKDLLGKYYPVGGVRIEDDILVTEDGFENLTTAPKGNEALKIINEGKESIAKEKQKRGWLWWCSRGLLWSLAK